MLATLACGATASTGKKAAATRPAAGQSAACTESGPRSFLLSSQPTHVYQPGRRPRHRRRRIHARQRRHVRPPGADSDESTPADQRRAPGQPGRWRHVRPFLRPPAKMACDPPQNRADLKGKIIFWTDRESEHDYQVESIYVMNPDGSNQKPLAPARTAPTRASKYLRIACRSPTTASGV